MEAGLVRFVGALRRAGLPISADETRLAAQSIGLLGYQDRGQLKHALSVVLAKSELDKQRFSDCFDRYYDIKSAPDAQDSEEEQAKEQTANEVELTPQLEQLLQASPEQLQLEIQQAGANANVEEIRLFTQRGVYLRRMLQQLDWRELQQAIIDAEAANNIESSPSNAEGTAGSGQIGAMRSLAAQMQEMASDYIERQYLLHGKPQSEQLRNQMLMEARINRMDPSQVAHCRKLVARIVKRLTRHFKRRKRYFRRGMLDLHSTLRHNMSTDGALFKLHWRRKHRDRPRVFVLCDVSGSVRQYAEMMLLFVYSLQDILPRSQCYAFAHRVEDISALLKARGDIEQAIGTTLHSIGGGATDYAEALRGFEREAGPMLNRNSVIIVLGDARNNRGDPALETFRRCTSKAGTTYWLNPESRFAWNSGDSVMDQYSQYCDASFEVGTLAQLQRFCEYLLRKTL